MTQLIPPPADDPRPPRRFRLRRRVILLLAILVIWQGAIRRPTPHLSGTSLNPVEHPAPYSRATLRVATFNIAGGVSPTDNRLDLDRTARYLHNFDIIGMQEVHGIGFFEWRDQARILGESLHMPWLFAASESRWWCESFGNGVLCDLPVTQWDRFPLNSSISQSNRTLLRVIAQWQGRPLTVLITHLDRHEDHEIELGAAISALMDSPEPAILLGDLNIDAGSDAPLKALRADPKVTDALGIALGANMPAESNDWIFARGLRCIGGGLTDNDASDHKLAWAELAPGGPE